MTYKNLIHVCNAQDVENVMLDFVTDEDTIEVDGIVYSASRICSQTGAMRRMFQVIEDPALRVEQWAMVAMEFGGISYEQALAEYYTDDDSPQTPVHDDDDEYIRSLPSPA